MCSMPIIAHLGITCPQKALRENMGAFCSCGGDKPAEKVEEIKGHLKVPIVWMLGAPGSGLEAQVRRIKRRYKLHDLSPAPVMKREMEARTERGRHLAEAIMKDTLPNVNVLLDLFRHDIHEYMHSTNGFYMLHFPLSVEQGTFFEELVAPADLIFYFQCHESVAKQRLSHGAGEEAAEATLHKRLAKFFVHAQPVLKHYGDRVIRINSDGNPDDVFDEVIEVFENLFKDRKFQPTLPFNRTPIDIED